VNLEQKVLSENDRRASEIRRRLAEHKVLALNLVSSPGAGKTRLLERTLQALDDRLRMAVIAGDVQTENDADRLKRAGGKRVYPIVTGGACHLDARMVTGALEHVDLGQVDVLFIENVGNLVCPASYDLGEDFKVVLISTTEGDDKPLKYPAMFRRSSLMILNKIDLLGTSEFDPDTVKANALRINGQLEIFDVSCARGDGLEAWYRWLSDHAHAKRSA
jgi:hydrogenase nickel incorporation protein HypB